GPSEVIVLGNDGENFVEIQRLSDVVVSERNSVVTEDFDADGLGDVALVNTRASTLSIFHGGVDGRLAAPETVAFVRRPVALTAADFDVDGDVDFVVAHEGTGDLTVIWSEEKRSYTQINYRGFENYDYDANSLSVGNLNGDDVPDIAVSGVLQTDITRWIVRTIVGFPGGGFADAETLTDRETPVGADRPQVLITNFRRGAVDQVVTATPGFSRVAIFGVENEGGGDFNGDGIPDNCRFHTFRRGDANSDEEVNISDAVDILTHLFVIRQDFSCSKSADVNDDGNINISDSIGLLGYLFLGSSAPPAPFPDCGLEETQDRLWCEEPVCGV
ncbi:MAG: FG-GAP-like repeat-containing protein, partial [Planctomycetota bacterium]